MNTFKPLFAIAALTVSVSLFAQDAPRFIDKSILVQSRVLPSDYQLFLPDTASQILFNPARAAFGGRQFIYTTYLPTNTTPTSPSSSFSGQSLMLASYFELGGGKFVAQASHSVQRTTLDGTSVLNEIPFNFSSSLPQQTTTNLQNTSVMPHALSLSRVWESGFSVGVYGFIEPSTRSSNGSFTLLNQSIQNGTFSQLRTTSSQSISSEASRYGFGTEVGFAGNDWDVVANVGYEFGGDNQSAFNTSTRFDSTFTSTTLWNSVLRVNSNDGLRNLDFKGVSSRIYAQQAVSGLSERDNIFFSATGAFYSRDISSRLEQLSSERSLSATSSPITSNLLAQRDTTAGLHQIRFNASFGYVVRPKLEDVDLLIALNPIGGYFKDQTLSNPSVTTLSISFSSPFVKRTEVNWSIGTRIPLFASFWVTEWFRVFGSFVFDMQYNHTEINTEELLPRNSNQSGFPLSQSSTTLVRSEGNTSNFTTTQLFNLGTDLRHKSGLNVQLLFGSDLAQFRSWNVSVGYLF